jgi:hypothetical protein
MPPTRPQARATAMAGALIATMAAKDESGEWSL